MVGLFPFLPEFVSARDFAGVLFLAGRAALGSTNDLTLDELQTVLGHVERVKDRAALEALGAVLEAEREGRDDA